MLPSDDTKKDTIDRTQLNKVVLAQRVGKSYAVKPKEAEAIVIAGLARALAEDISALVRETLAFEVRRSQFLPKEIATIIAKDIESVAGPFLEATEIFTDKELSKIVPIVEEFARISIAKRRKITHPLTVSLIKHGSEKSVIYLVRNKGSEFQIGACSMLMDKFSKSEDLLNQFSARDDLPIGAVYILSQKVSAEFREKLVSHYKISLDHASYLTNESSEQVLSDTLKEAPIGKIQTLVNDLASSNRLTPELILNYTRRGNLAFFEASISKLTGLPFDNVKRLIEESGFTVLIKLLEKAEIPESHFRGFRDALKKILSP